MRYIELQGGPREIGRRHGAAFAEDIRKCFEFYCVRARKTRVSPLIRTYLEERFPEVAEEIEGIGEGAGLSYEQMLAYNHFNVIAGCTPIFFSHSDVGPLLAQNLDCEREELDAAVVRNVIPDKGNAYLGVSFVGTVWVGNWINQEGVARAAVSAHHHPYRTDDGTSMAIIDRVAAQYASNLVEALRAGTCFGPVDYLTTADLTHVPLQRYGAIIAPAALGLSLDDSHLLAEYVRSGGALLADLGLGLHTNGDWRYLPEPLAAAFVISSIWEIKALAGTLSVSGSIPWLPHVVRGMKSKGSFRARMPGGSGPETYQAGSYAVGSYAGYAPLMQGATAVAVVDVDNSTPEAPLFAGVIGAHYGRGVAVFATHPLYQHWPLSDPLSAALHYDVLGRGRACELIDEPLIPAATEISVEADRIRVLNASAEHRRVVIALHSGDDRLVTSALTVNHAAYTAGEANQQVEVSVPPNSLAAFSSLPIRLQPYTDDVAAVVAEFSRNRVQLSVAAPGAALAPTRAQPYHFSRPTHAIRVRFEVRSGGGYDVADGSVHAVTMQTERGQTRTFDIVAKSGVLSFTEEVYREMVTIQPRHPAL